MSHPTYRPEVDGLRALAVVPVILFHAGYSWFSGGYVGVDVFFVISGYLITSIILAEKSDGTFTIARFYERRARRILPALLFVTAVCLVFGWRWLLPQQLRDFAASVVAVMLFASNVLFWRTSGYFNSSAEEKPLLHTWSLGVEEQYYVLFPLFVILLWSSGRRRQVWLLAAIALGSFGLSEWVSRRDPMANFYLAPTRAWELLLGSLLAFASFVTPLQQRVSGMAAEALSSLGLLMIVGAVFAFDKLTPIPGVYALVPTVGTALLLGFGGNGTYAARLLSARWIVGVGLISYSAYLWHQPLFAFARVRMLEKPGPALFGLLSASAFVLAYVTWRFVEAPFRDRKRVSRRILVALCLGGSLTLVVAGLSGKVGEGYPGRLDASTRALIATAAYSPRREACHTLGRDFLDPAKACVYFNDNATWASFGDSHTIEPAYALAEQLAGRDQGLVHLSFSGCPPALLVEVQVPGCRAWLNRALERIENDRRILNVLVGFRYSYHLFGEQLETYPKLPDQGIRVGQLSSADSREALWRSFVAILDRLQKSGKRVFVLLPVPELGRDVHSNIQARMRQSEDYSQEIGRAHV